MGKKAGFFKFIYFCKFLLVTSKKLEKGNSKAVKKTSCVSEVSLCDSLM